MMRTAMAWIAMAMAGTVTLAQAEEITLSIDHDGVPMAATLELPQGEPAPVVLLLHGFSGSRDELPVANTEDGVFSRTAEALANAGYASLRIDFRGSGESGGAWQDTTFSGQTADAIQAIDWLATDPRVDGTRISVLGWSQGGLVAAHAAAERPDILSLILWAPVVNAMATYPAILGEITLSEIMAMDPQTPITRSLPWGVDTTLNASFFQEMPLTSTAGAVAAYPGPMQVIVGLKDTLVAPQPASGQLLIDYHSGPQRLSVFDTDHVWDAFAGPDTLDTKMIPTTLDWLGQHH